MNHSSAPDLAPPGAGLPRTELLVARLFFALARRVLSQEGTTARFERERRKIAALIGKLDDTAASERVLIPRLRGLEDSSRYWSVWMTLDHLRIVHGAMAGVIPVLVAGHTPPGAADTAMVKPSPTVTSAVRGEYETSCERLLAVFAAAPRLDTTARYAHPWFGPLDAAGWHVLAGGHLGIHRRQIEAILARLPAAREAAIAG